MEFSDCTNGGISSKAHELCLVNVPGPFEPGKGCPGALLVEGNVPNTAKIVPLKKLVKVNGLCLVATLLILQTQDL